ncbi:trypsin-like serine protease [Linderina pennispora]|uniref:Trypsin-like serine protease n=1 Tax=Linderina pennispora TaxID=61395 RepID=A0A1Y1W448_9FUNG|nr:trypsin-like serine protease [Linderina pennispora]ORX68095.1 trypsin-like serine protease [Linderina pennispora]
MKTMRLLAALFLMFPFLHGTTAESHYGNARVTNGTLVASGEAPYFVRLKIITSPFAKRLCGGTLVNNSTVITAAHCIRNSDDTAVATTLTTFIYYGNNDSAKQYVTRATSIHVPPSYDSVEVRHDIAVIKIPPLEFVKGKVEFLSIYNGDIPPHSEMRVFGWGLTTTHGSSRDIASSLLTNYVYISEPKECQWVESRYTDANGPLICANNHYHIGADVCSGDSGVGTIIYVEGAPYMAGIVSYGSSISGELTCGEDGGFGLYTHIYQYINWIASINDTALIIGPEQPAPYKPLALEILQKPAPRHFCIFMLCI